MSSLFNNYKTIRPETFRFINIYGKTFITVSRIYFTIMDILVYERCMNLLHDFLFLCLNFFHTDIIILQAHFYA